MSAKEHMAEMLEMRNSGATLETISVKFGITRARVWQILKQAERMQRREQHDSKCNYCSCEHGFPTDGHISLIKDRAITFQNGESVDIQIDVIEDSFCWGIYCGRAISLGNAQIKYCPMCGKKLDAMPLDGEMEASKK